MLCLLGLPAAPAMIARIAEGTAAEVFPLRRAFLDHGAPTLVRLGTAQRARHGMAVYTVAFYADLGLLRARAGRGQGIARLPDLLRSGEVPVALVFRYAQGISAERRREFNAQALRNCWPSPGFDPDHPEYRVFEDHFQDPIQRGAEFQVWIAQGVMQLRTAGGAVNRVAFPELCRAFLACYLTDQRLPGETHALREELLRELPRRLREP